jgi:hypothetical protein
MEVQELVNKSFTQFPFSVQFTSKDIAPALLYVTASAYSSAPNQPIGVTVSLDDKPLGNLMIYANEAMSHKALVGMLFPVQLDLNPHTLKFSAASPHTVCDASDIIGAALVMLSDVPPFLWNTNGPIPRSTTFSSQTSGPALLFFSGSAYRNTSGPIEIDVTIAGKPVATSKFQASKSLSHQACPPRFTPVMLQYSKDPVQIGFSTNSGDVSSDPNDYYQLALIY